MDGCNKEEAEQRSQNNGDDGMIGSYSIQPSQECHKIYVKRRNARRQNGPSSESQERQTTSPAEVDEWYVA